MNWKKFSFLFGLVLTVSVLSALTTRYVLTHRSEKRVSWSTLLNLTPEQEKAFSALESEFNLALKDIEMQDAKDKMAICSYLHAGNQASEEIKKTTKDMAKSYEAKQEKLAATLASITRTLTPQQKETFMKRLMHEICVSCKKATGLDQCICGMCKA